MSILLLVLAFLAMMHFIYEGIIAPSHRVVVRCRLFTQRDALRELAMTDRRMSARHFEKLHDVINESIRRSHSVSVWTLLQVLLAEHRDPAMKARAKANIRLFQESGAEEVFSNTVTAMFTSVRINSLGLMLMVIPAVLAFVVASKIKELVRDLTTLPPRSNFGGGECDPASAY